MDLACGYIRALSWLEAEHEPNAMGFELEEFRDVADVGWLRVTVTASSQGMARNVRRGYVLSPLGRVWRAIDGHRFGDPLREADYDSPKRPAA